MIKAIAAVIGSVLVVLVLGLAGLAGAKALGFNLFAVNQVDRSQPALLKSVQDMSQFHAAKGNFEIVLDVEDNVEGVHALIAGRRTLFVAAGTVDGYVDLTGLAEGDLTLSEDGKAVTVRLPESQLDKPNLDNDRSYVFTQERGVIDRIVDALQPSQQAQFYKLAETKLTTAAEESELREQATENTKTMLTGMFGSLGMDVTFLD